MLQSLEIYLGGLAYKTTEDDLYDYLKREGYRDATVRVIKDRETNRSRGYGFVMFTKEDDYDRFLEDGEFDLDGRTVSGCV